MSWLINGKIHSAVMGSANCIKRHTPSCSFGKGVYLSEMLLSSEIPLDPSSSGWRRSGVRSSDSKAPEAIPIRSDEDMRHKLGVGIQSLVPRFRD